MHVHVSEEMHAALSSCMFMQNFSSALLFLDCFQQVVACTASVTSTGQIEYTKKHKAMHLNALITC
jgi:hypothetical protein